MRCMGMMDRSHRRAFAGKRFRPQRFARTATNDNAFSNAEDPLRLPVYLLNTDIKTLLPKTPDSLGVFGSTPWGAVGTTLRGPGGSTRRGSVGIPTRGLSVLPSGGVSVLPSWGVGVIPTGTRGSGAPCCRRPNPSPVPMSPAAIDAKPPICYHSNCSRGRNPLNPRDAP